MIHSLLIANRGEIAQRIIRSCQRLGIKTVVIYSQADAELPFVLAADQAVALEGFSSSDTYLNIDKILDAAHKTGANAIHPGYGFLSENANFARRVIAAGLIWVGPHPQAIELMGLKAAAKAIAETEKVPTIQGYKGADQGKELLYNKALEIGFPVLIKASAGGGGKGMRIVQELSTLSAAIESAQQEALSSFGDATLLIEKYFPSARHIEIQVLGDKHGNCIHLLERECSIQRRYQKIIEESPSPVLSEATRAEMGAAALRLCKAIGYDNAGTVEFIYTTDENFYFLEVNTRLQVEHPVTEAITGVDLVEWQLRIAAGEVLTLQQSDIKANGYALECRLYAEDPDNNFMPVTGQVLDYYCPPVDGLRYENGIQSGTTVGVYYDPMLSKIIAHAPNRALAINRMHYALSKLRCLGLTTNQGFLMDLMQHSDFKAGNYDTHFLQDKFLANNNSKKNSKGIQEAIVALCLYQWRKRQRSKQLLQAIPSGWRNNFYQGQELAYYYKEELMKLRYRQEKDTLELEIAEDYKVKARIVQACSKEIRIEIDSIQQTFFVVEKGADFFVQHPEEGAFAFKAKERYPMPKLEKLKGGYEAAIPGEINRVLVTAGQEVKDGDPLLVLVSMKMENTIIAHADGILEEIYVSPGDTVQAGTLLLKMQ